MSRRTSRQSQGFATRRKGQIIVAVILVVSLFAAWTMLASSGALDRVFSQKPEKKGIVSIASFNSNSPSKEYIYAGGGRLVATEEPTASANVPAPTNLVASAMSDTQITLTWSWSDPGNPPVDYYEVQKTQNFSDQNGWSTLTPNPTDTFITYTVTNRSAYMYRVRAVRGGLASNYSNNDMATAIIFTDDPLSPPNTVTIKAIHLTQVRDAVNAVRALANPVIFPPITNWTDPSPQGAYIKAQQMLELRTSVNPALTALVLPTVANDSSLAFGNPIRGVHLQDVRDKVK